MSTRFLSFWPVRSPSIFKVDGAETDYISLFAIDAFHLFDEPVECQVPRWRIKTFGNHACGHMRILIVRAGESCLFCKKK